MSFFPPFLLSSPAQQLSFSIRFSFCFCFRNSCSNVLLTCLFSCGCPLQLSSAVCVAQISFISFLGPLLPFTGTEGSTHRTRTNSTLAPLCGYRSPQLSGKHDGYINRNYISHDAIIHLFNMLQLIILVT